MRGREFDQLRESLSSYIADLDTILQGAVAHLKSITLDPAKKPEEKRTAIQGLKEKLEEDVTVSHQAFWSVWEPFLEKFQIQPTCMLGGLVKEQ